MPERGAIVTMHGLRVGLLGLLIIVLSACGGDGSSNPPGGETPNDELTQEEAVEFSSLAVASNSFILAPFFSSNGFSPLATANLALRDAVLPAAGRLSPQQEECTTVTGSETDADNDGIPVNLTLIADCDITYEGGRIIFKGSIRVQDKDDSNPASGYSVVYDNYELTVTSEGETASIKIDMNFDLTISGSVYRADYDFDLSVSSPEGSGRIAFDYVISYTPDNAADPFAAGTFVFDGSLQYSGDGENYSMRTSSAGLHYSATCGDFDSGSSRYQDNAGNTVAVTYNSCGNVTVTYNGSPLSP